MQVSILLLIQIYDSTQYALPVARNPVKIIYSSDECEAVRIILCFIDWLIIPLPLCSSAIMFKFVLQVKAMEGRWSSSSFATTETRLLLDLVNIVKKGESLAW